MGWRCCTKKAKLVKGNVCNKLPFKDNNFDYLICINSIVNLPEINKEFFDEISRITKRDGIIIFDIRNKLNLYSYYRYSRYENNFNINMKTYTLRRIKKMLMASLEILQKA